MPTATERQNTWKRHCLIIRRRIWGVERGREVYGKGEERAKDIAWMELVWAGQCSNSIGEELWRW